MNGTLLKMTGVHIQSLKQARDRVSSDMAVLRNKLKSGGIRFSYDCDQLQRLEGNLFDTTMEGENGEEAGRERSFRIVSDPLA